MSEIDYKALYEQLKQKHEQAVQKNQELTRLINRMMQAVSRTGLDLQVFAENHKIAGTE